MVGKTALPGNWQNFIRIDSNKRELFSLFYKIRRSVRKTSKLSSPLGRVLRTQLLQDVHTLSPCSPEEAESRMLLHVTHAAHHGHHQILIRTVDTDVVVLAVFAITYLPAGCKVWLAFGTGKSFRLHGSQPNSCEPWTRDVMCPKNIPCFDML